MLRWLFGVAGILIFSLSIQRLQFYWWHYSDLKGFEWTVLLKSFANGLRFDLFFVSLMVLLLLLIRPIRRIQQNYNFPVYSVLVLIWTLLVFVLITLNMVDAELIQFHARRLTFESLFVFNEAKNKIWDYLAYAWPLALTTILIVSASLYFLVRWIFQPQDWKRSEIYHLIWLLPLLVLGIRGGWQVKPIGLAHAQVFPQPILNIMVLNTPFTILKSVGKETLPRYQFIDDPREMWTLLPSQQQNESAPRDLISAKQKTNVVILILESFSKEYMGFGHATPGWTPFLDQLAQDPKALFFPNAYAHGKRSIEGIVSILAGIPPMMDEPLLSSAFAGNRIQGIASRLREQGYETEFYHSAQNGSMFFDQMARAAGFEKYFGLNEYPNTQEDYDGSWGIWDHKYFDYISRNWNQREKPFFATIFTMSSHHPFRLPPGFEKQFQASGLDIAPTVAYVDWALKNFFEANRNQKWFQNTLFIITADHTYKPWREEYRNNVGQFRVPLLFYHPNWNPPKVDTQQFVNHIDIAPSIMDAVGFEFERSDWPLSRSVFRSGMIQSFYRVDQTLYWMNSEVLAKWNAPDDLTFFKVSDHFEKSPLSPPPEIRMEILKKIQGLMQFYSEAMWNNAWVKEEQSNE